MVMIWVVAFSCSRIADLLRGEGYIMLCKGPELKKFEQKIVWYGVFTKDPSLVSMIWLPRGFGLNSPPLRSFDENEVDSLISQRDSARFLKFKTQAKHDLRVQIFEANRGKSKREKQRIVDNAVYIYLNLDKNFHLYPGGDTIDVDFDVIDNLITQKENEINNILNSWDYLLFSPNYRRDSSVVLPQSFQNYVESIFESIKSKTMPETPRQKEAIDQAKIVFEHREDFPLWAFSDIFEKEVYISPYLLRAAFLATCNEEKAPIPGHEMRPRNLAFMDEYQIGKDRFEEQVASIVNWKFDRRFQRSIDFLVLHELAHIYLKENDNEAKCDCYAAVTLKPSEYFTKNELLGQFSNILESSLRSNRADLWGLVDVRKLEARIHFLRSMELDSLTFQDCHDL